MNLHHKGETTYMDIALLALMKETFKSE